MKKLLKYTVLLLIGGLVFNLFEILWRGYSHWTMLMLGGICFIFLGLINEALPWKTPLWLQMLIGGTVITLLELLTGYIVNIRLGWAVWDYSKLPLNFHGQICPQFWAVWCLLSSIGIVLDDYLRYWFFGEDKPHYKLI